MWAALGTLIAAGVAGVVGFWVQVLQRHQKELDAKEAVFLRFLQAFGRISGLKGEFDLRINAGPDLKLAAGWAVSEWRERFDAAFYEFRSSLASVNLVADQQTWDAAWLMNELVGTLSMGPAPDRPFDWPKATELRRGFVNAARVELRRPVLDHQPQASR